MIYPGGIVLDMLPFHHMALNEKTSPHRRRRGALAGDPSLSRSSRLRRLDQGHDAASDTRMEALARDFIDAALACGGRYYLNGTNWIALPVARHAGPIRAGLPAGARVFRPEAALPSSGNLREQIFPKIHPSQAGKVAVQDRPTRMRAREKMRA